MTKFSWTGAAGSTKVLHSPFLILDLGLDIVDGVGRLHLQGDGLARDWNYCQYNSDGGILLSRYIRVFTKICMVSVLLDLV